MKGKEEEEEEEVEWKKRKRRKRRRSLPLSLSVCWNFQTSRKASPIFLFAAPRYLSTIECTTFAIVFTNTMTSSCSTSVASVKFRMSQKPKMAYCFLPAIISSISPTLTIFCPIISAPASPKPNPSNTPILLIADSIISVS